MRYRRADGKTFDFKLKDDGSLVAPYGHDERLTLTSGAYQISDPYGSLTTVFRSDGLVDHVRDKQGRPIEYQYDGAGRLIAQTTSSGQWIHYSYAADGMLERAADSNGRSAYLSHEGLQLASIRNPQDGLVRYAYDARGFLAEAINPDGRRALANSYSGSGQVLAQSVGEGSAPMTFSFGERATRVRDPAGNWALVRYDKYGRTSSVTTERAGRTVLHRGKDGIVSGLTRADGRTAGLTFDSAGRITRLKTFAGETVETDYDAASNVKSITDELGRTTSYAYDESNFITSATDARGQQTRFGWRAGLLGSVTNAADEVTSYSYDDQGRIATVTDPTGHRTSRQYDQHGYLSKSTDELGRESLTEHSPMGQLTASIDAAGARTDFARDANGNLTRTRDALGNVFSTEYDAQQRPVASFVNAKLASRTEYDDGEGRRKRQHRTLLLRPGRPARPQRQCRARDDQLPLRRARARHPPDRPQGQRHAVRI
jgi:YD repeat-containing protein